MKQPMEMKGARAVASSSLESGAKAPPERLRHDELKTLAAEVGRRAAPVFAAAGWEWGKGATGMEVPSEARITARVLELLEDAGEEHTFDGGSVRTGRLEVIREIEEGENIEWCTVNLEIGFATATPAALPHTGEPASAPAASDKRAINQTIVGSDVSLVNDRGGSLGSGDVSRGE